MAEDSHGKVRAWQDLRPAARGQVPYRGERTEVIV